MVPFESSLSTLTGKVGMFLGISTGRMIVKEFPEGGSSIGTESTEIEGNGGPSITSLFLIPDLRALFIEPSKCLKSRMFAEYIFLVSLQWLNNGGSRSIVYEVKFI